MKWVYGFLLLVAAQFLGNVTGVDVTGDSYFIGTMVGILFGEIINYKG